MVPGTRILWILESLGLASSQISSGHPPGVRGCLGLLGCNWICPAAVCPKQGPLEAAIAGQGSGTLAGQQGQRSGGWCHGGFDKVSPQAGLGAWAPPSVWPSSHALTSNVVSCVQLPAAEDLRGVFQGTGAQARPQGRQLLATTPAALGWPWISWGDT